MVSALTARTGFGKLLRRVEDENRSLVIEKRGTPKAVLLSIRDYVRLASPEPEVLRLLGEESKRKGTDKLTVPRHRPGDQSRARRKAQARIIPLRLVIDTNIVVSAALKPDGLQRTVLILALTKPATLYVTEAILAEYRDVLQRPRFDIPKGAASSSCSSSRTARVPSGPRAYPRWHPIPTTTCFWNAPTPHAPITW